MIALKLFPYRATWTWMLPRSSKQEEESQKGTSSATILAKGGVNTHSSNQEEYDRGDDGALLVATTQSMIKDVWIAYFEADQDAKNS